MATCLPKKSREALTLALKTKDITIDKLYKLSEVDRRTLLTRFVGEENARFVNAKFEQAMLSRQKNALANWIKATTSFKDPIRKDMLKKVERIEKFLEADKEHGFMEDLAEMKLGIKVSEIEAKTILELKTRIDELKAKIPENSPIRSNERLAYGFAVDAFKTFIGERKLGAESIKFKERFLPKNFGKNIVDFAAVTKSLVATFDNSFLGRQGIKALLRGDYKIWGTTVVGSFKNMSKELFAKSEGLFEARNDAVMASIRADIWSRPNALNGKYKAAKNGYGLGVLHEEVFPTSFPERIPLLGRVFKASETTFTGSALRMRADLADAIIKNAEKHGVDMLNEAQASAHGSLITSLTGRGELGITAPVGKPLNVLLFSVRFLKSNFNTLTAHLFDKSMTREARRTAAMSTLKIAGSITALLSTAKMINEDSVDFDPRSTKFCKISIGGHRYDISGGMCGLVTLGSRIVPTFHDGEWGFWTKSATTGKYTKMSSGDFGEQTALDTFENFFEGKLSPTFAALRDIWKGKNFQGEKPDFVNTSIGLITPISAEMLIEELQKGNDDILLAMLAEALGISVTETTFRGFGKKWDNLREKRGENIFNQSLKIVTERFNARAERLTESSRWEKLTNDEKSKELDKIRREENNRIFNMYGIK